MKKSITVKTHAGNFTIQAEIFRAGFAVHKAFEVSDVPAWTVTHLDSGHAFTRADTKQGAIRGTRQIARILAANGFDAKSFRRQDFKRLPKSAQEQIMRERGM